MLVLLLRFLVTSDKLLVVFIQSYFDGLCLCTHYCSVWHSVCLLSGSSKETVCVVMLFYSKTEQLHNTDEMVGMRVGLVCFVFLFCLCCFEMNRSFMLVFTSCNRHICYLKTFFTNKHKYIFFKHFACVSCCPHVFHCSYRTHCAG